MTLILTTPFDKVLFDMDGTLVDSRAVVERVWRGWAAEHGLDPEEILTASHGRRSRDTVERFATATMDIEAEATKLESRETDDTEGLVAVAGAAELLARLPADSWALVTSAGRDLARRRLSAVGLPLPDLLISAEDVRAGKPDPEGYRLAAQRLGTKAERCLVFEDAPAGIAAGLAAGSTVVAIRAARPLPFDPECPEAENFTEVSFRLSDGTQL